MTKDEICSDEEIDEDMNERQKREFISVINKKGEEYDEKLLEMVLVEDILEELKNSEE